MKIKTGLHIYIISLASSLTLWMWRASKRKLIGPANHPSSTSKAPTTQSFSPHITSGWLSSVRWFAPCLDCSLGVCQFAGDMWPFFEVHNWGMILCCSLMWCPWVPLWMVWCEQFWFWCGTQFWWGIGDFFVLLLSLDLELMVLVVEVAQHLKVKNSWSWIWHFLTFI